MCSRGVGFKKNFRKFGRDFFFRLTKLIFRALPNIVKIIFWPNFLRCQNKPKKIFCAAKSILYLYVPGFHRKIFKHDKILSARSEKLKEQKKNKGSVLVVESAYNSQKTQFGLVLNLGSARGSNPWGLRRDIWAAYVDWIIWKLCLGWFFIQSILDYLIKQFYQKVFLPS